MTKDQLIISLSDIQKAMEIEVSIDNPTGIMEKMNALANLIGLSAECFAWSERYYNEKLSELVLAKQYKDLSATDKKMLFAGLACEEIHNHTHAERLNKGLTHAIDGLRSMLSFLKEELNKVG